MGLKGFVVVVVVVVVVVFKFVGVLVPLGAVAGCNFLCKMSCATGDWDFSCFIYPYCTADKLPCFFGEFFEVLFGCRSS